MISPIESQTASVDRLSFETRLHIVRSLPHLSSLQSIIHPFPSSSSSGSILNTASLGDIYPNIPLGTVPIPSLLDAPHTSDSRVLRSTAISPPLQDDTLNEDIPQSRPPQSTHIIAHSHPQHYVLHPSHPLLSETLLELLALMSSPKTQSPTCIVHSTASNSAAFFSQLLGIQYKDNPNQTATLPKNLAVEYETYLSSLKSCSSIPCMGAFFHCL